MPEDFAAVTITVTSKQVLFDVLDSDSFSTTSQFRSFAYPSTRGPSDNKTLLLPVSIDATTTATKESTTTDAGVPAGTAVIAPIAVLGVCEGTLEGDPLGKLELGVNEGD